MVEETAAAHGRLDYLFNNAGMAIGGDARDLTLDHWRRVLDVDLYGVLHGTLAAYPIMASQGFGHIVNTSSAAAFFPDPGSAPYCTAKHAIVGLSLSLRLEGADLGVKVSCVCPGFVRTNVYQNAGVVNMPAVAALSGRARGAGRRHTGQNDGAIAGGAGDPRRRGPQPGCDRLSRLASAGPGAPYRLFPGLSDRILLRQMRASRRLPDR